MHILKKGIVIIPMIAAAFITQVSFAADHPVELKKSCIKNNPLAAGDSDPALIALYTQICDNNKNQQLANDLNIQIAQKYQALGHNLKALQMANQLRNQNINTPEITDVTFLAGIAISQNALNHMRTAELRSLTEMAYAPAKQLAETVRFAQPTVDISKAPAKIKSLHAKSAENKSTAKKLKKANAIKTSTVKSQKTSKPAVAKESMMVKNTNSSSASPFDTLNKK